MVFTAYYEEDLKKIIPQIVQQFGEKNNFFLIGELGSGKTTFTRYFADFLGCKEVVSSPSFTLLNLYSYPNGTIYHMDLYRIQNQEEAIEAGLEEILEVEGVKIFEWMNLFSFYIKNGIRIDFEVVDNERRTMRLERV